MRKKRESDQTHFFETFLETTTDRIKDRIEDREDDLKDYLDEDSLFLIRSFVIKDAYHAAEQFIQYLKEKYKRELNYSKENIFPLKWMTKDKEIATFINNHSVFLPIINYIHNRNRRASTPDFADMVEQADKLTGGRRYFDKYIYSDFYTDKAFYDKMTQKIKVSKNLIQTYLAAFAKLGIYKIRYDSGNRGRLYADGYFTEYDNKRTKHSFIKDGNYIKQQLRILPEHIKTYARQDKES